MKGYFEATERFTGTLSACLTDGTDAANFAAKNPGCDPENIRINRLSPQLKDDIKEDVRNHFFGFEFCEDLWDSGSSNDYISFISNGVRIEINIDTDNKLGNPFFSFAPLWIEENPFPYSPILDQECDKDILFDKLFEDGRFDENLTIRDYIKYYWQYRMALAEAYIKTCHRPPMIGKYNNADIDPNCETIRVNGQTYTAEGLELCNALKAAGEGKFADELAKAFELRKLIPKGEYIPAYKAKDEEIER